MLLSKTFTTIAIIAVAAATFGMTSARSNDEIRLDRLTDAAKVALQRGYSIADGACAFAILNEIEAYGGAAAMRDFFIEFGGPQIKISSPADGVTHTCRSGRHIYKDTNTSCVMQIYDDNGKPTLMEP